MSLEIYKRGQVYWAKGWVEYNGRRIAGPYRRSTKASTEAGARDWVARETGHKFTAMFSGMNRA